jgi:tetrahydromethanopterin S-methyltransferase subunit G
MPFYVSSKVKAAMKETEDTADRNLYQMNLVHKRAVRKQTYTNNYHDRMVEYVTELRERSVAEAKAVIGAAMKDLRDNAGAMKQANEEVKSKHKVAVSKLQEKKNEKIQNARRKFRGRGNKLRKDYVSWARNAIKRFLLAERQFMKANARANGKFPGFENGVERNYEEGDSAYSTIANIQSLYGQRVGYMEAETAENAESGADALDEYDNHALEAELHFDDNSLWHLEEASDALRDVMDVTAGNLEELSARVEEYSDMQYTKGHDGQLKFEQNSKKNLKKRELIITQMENFVERLNDVSERMEDVGGSVEQIIFDSFRRFEKGVAKEQEHYEDRGRDRNKLFADAGANLVRIQEYKTQSRMLQKFENIFKHFQVMTSETNLRADGLFNRLEQSIVSNERKLETVEKDTKKLLYEKEKISEKFSDFKQVPGRLEAIAKRVEKSAKWYDKAGQKITRVMKPRISKESNERVMGMRKDMFKASQRLLQDGRELAEGMDRESVSLRREINGFIDGGIRSSRTSKRAIQHAKDAVDSGERSLQSMNRTLRDLQLDIDAIPTTGIKRMRWLVEELPPMVTALRAQAGAAMQAAGQEAKTRVDNFHKEESLEAQDWMANLAGFLDGKDGQWKEIRRLEQGYSTAVTTLQADSQWRAKLSGKFDFSARNLERKFTSDTDMINARIETSRRTMMDAVMSLDLERHRAELAAMRRYKRIYSDVDGAWQHAFQRYEEKVKMQTYDLMRAMKGEKDAIERVQRRMGLLVTKDEADLEESLTKIAQPLGSLEAAMSKYGEQTEPMVQLAVQDADQLDREVEDEKSRRLLGNGTDEVKSAVENMTQNYAMKTRAEINQMQSNFGREARTLAQAEKEEMQRVVEKDKVSASASRAELARLTALMRKEQQKALAVAQEQHAASCGGGLLGRATHGLAPPLGSVHIAAIAREHRDFARGDHSRACHRRPAGRSY